MSFTLCRYKCLNPYQIMGVLHAPNVEIRYIDLSNWGQRLRCNESNRIWFFEPEL